MTFRPPLIITIYPRPKAAEPYYNVRILSLIAPNPSKPFHQDDWPRPAPPGKVQASDAPANLYPWQHPNPAKPFHQDDWSQQAALARPKAKVDDFVNVLLGQTFFIISQDLWDNAVLSRPKAKVDDFVNLLPVHTGTVVVAPPISQPLWETAALSRPKITDTSLAPPSPLFTPNPSIPFRQNLWEGAVKSWPKAGGEAQGGDAALLTPNPSIPFNQNLWEGESAKGKARVDDFVNLLPVQTGVVVVQFPFGPMDWPRPTIQLKAKVDDFVNLLPVQSGVVVVQYPFGPTDWPRPATPQQKITDTSIAASAPLYTPNPAAPFTSWDIAVLDRPISIKSDIFVNPLPLQTPTTPFTLSQDDFPNPVLGRQKVYAESFGLNLPRNFPNPTRPFQQSDWASATRGFPAAGGHFYPINPNLQPPPIIIPAKPDNLHFLADVGRLMSR